MPDEFDKPFEDAFEEAVRGHRFAPDFEASWRRVEKRLARRRRNRARLRALPYAAGAFLLGGLLFGSPPASRAFEPFYQHVKQWPQGVVSVVFGTDQRSEGHTVPKTAPPPEYEPKTDQGPPEIGIEGEGLEGVGTSTTFATDEEAAAAADFKLPKIGYAPEGYAVEKILGFYPPPPAKKAYSVVWSYSDGGQGRYTINLQALAGNAKMSTEFRDRDGTLKTIRLHDTDAYLFITRDGWTSLEYMQGGVYTAIVGNLSEEELLKVGEGLE